MREREETQVGLGLETREEKTLDPSGVLCSDAPGRSGEREPGKDPLELPQRRPL